MARKERFTFESCNPGSTITARRWLPENTEPRAVLQIHHGMAEYINRYDEFASFLADQGIVVVGSDHLGHGDSAQSKEGFGYFGPAQDRNLLVEDMHRLTALTKQTYPTLPYFIFGHSMGSFLVREYVVLYGAEINGAVVCGTGDLPLSTIRSAQALIKILTLFQGEHARSMLVTRIMFGAYNDRFKPTRTPFDWLTRDERIVDDYIEKDATGFIFTLNAFAHMAQNLAYVCSQEGQRRIPVSLPLLFISGNDDPVGEYGQAVPRLVKRLRQYGAEDIEYILYENDRHEIINELDRAQVYADVLAWMDRHLPVESQSKE